MKDPAKAALKHILCATEENDPQLEGKLTTCFQVVNYLLVTHDKDDVKVEFEGEITTFKEPERMSAVRYLDVLWKSTML